MFIKKSDRRYLFLLLHVTEKLADFDLFFTDADGYSRTPIQDVQTPTSLSVCLWLRFLQPKGRGAFFTLSGEMLVFSSCMVFLPRTK